MEPKLPHLIQPTEILTTHRHWLIISFLAIVILGGAISWSMIFLGHNPFQKTPVVSMGDQLKDWQTYQNDEYGFEFQYPKDFAWGPSVRDSSVLLYGGRGGATEMEVDVGKVGFAGSEDQKIVINGTPVYLSSSGVGSDQILGYIIPKEDNLFFQFVFHSSLDKITIGNILSTFKFTTPVTTTTVDTTSWKTYTNDTYKFELKYPGDWEDINGTRGSKFFNIAYRADQKIFSHGVGYSYPGEIFIRGIKKEDLLPQGPISSSLVDFAQAYINTGLNDMTIVDTQIKIQGHSAVKIAKNSNVSRIDEPNLTVLIDYSLDSVILMEVSYFQENKNYITSLFDQILSTFKFTK